MKNKILLLVLVCSTFCIKAQTISCNQLYQAVAKSNYPETVNCYNSSMLVKVEYYTYNGTGVVVAYIKDNKYDYKGSPYIFCGISIYSWMNFKTSGYSNSWGEAFHDYIMDYKCNCD